MKTRSGFISNSSSCSFIVQNLTTTQLAKLMIEHRYLNHASYFAENIETMKSQPNNNTEEILGDLDKENMKYMMSHIDRYLKLTDNLKEIEQINSNQNLAFQSCNFNTFIKNITVGGKPYIYVATCNNEQWDIPKIIPKDKLDESSPEHYFNEGDLYDGLWDEYYLEGSTFTVIETKQTITIKDRKDRFDLMMGIIK